MMRYSSFPLILLLVMGFTTACGGPNTDSETHWQNNQGNQNDEPDPDADSDADSDGADADGYMDADGEADGGMDGDGDGDTDGESPDLLEISPDPLRFEDIVVGNTSTQDLNITNLSSFELDLIHSEFGLDDNQVFALAAPLSPLSASESITLPITFTPLSNRESYARFYLVYTRDGVESVQSLPVLGNPICINVPETLTFAESPVDAAETVTLTIENCSDYVEFEITELITVGEFNDVVNTISFENLDPLPILLPPNTSLDLDVRYTRHTEYQSDGTLQIRTDGHTRGIVEMTAEGIDRPRGSGDGSADSDGSTDGFSDDDADSDGWSDSDVDGSSDGTGSSDGSGSLDGEGTGDGG